MNKIYFLILGFIFQFNSDCIGQDFSCRMLRVITKDNFFSSKNSNEIYIVDTFGLFSSTCLFSDSSKKIFVVRQKPEQFTIVPHNLFYVSGVATEKNFLQIAVNNPRTSYQFIFYLSIFGNDIKLVKKKGGTPPS